MKKNQLKDGEIAVNSHGIGTVTPQMVHHRAAEIAIINGRSPQEMIEGDWEVARRELSGKPEESSREEAIEALPESQRWDPNPGSTGTQAPTISNDDEDDEGRSDNERLVEEGIAGAEHDQMLQATRQAEKKDRI